MQSLLLWWRYNKYYTSRGHVNKITYAYIIILCAHKCNNGTAQTDERRRPKRIQERESVGFTFSVIIHGVSRAA